MKPGAHARSAAAALMLALGLSGTAAMAAPGSDDAWSSGERAVLASIQLSRLPAAPPDPSNAVESLPAAAALGKRLFFDPRLSRNQQVACATCHMPDKQFQDSRPTGIGVGTGIRRTMPIADMGGQAWLFWDGRKDSVWSQALGPLEDANEHGGDRAAYAAVIGQHYKRDYEALFQSLPALDALPAHASPNGTAAERAAWNGLNTARQQDVSRVFANIGKAIAAYEATLHHAPSQLDRYIAATLSGAAAAPSLMSTSEKRGLRLFIGKATCISCHGGPLLTDQHFHNTGVRAHDVPPETGRATAIAKLLRDEFNCLGPYSDARRANCQELQFIAVDDPHMVGAFKTPSLRNVALRAPYMHAGQIASLTGVVRHYAAAPRAVVGHSERRPIALSEQEIEDLAGFLATLSGPIEERKR